ncbi:MAG TPA: extensin family protein [Kofleriaceae bacterium]
MSRVLLIFMLAIGVSSVDAAPKKSGTSETKKKKHKKQKREKDDRTPNKRTKANMPQGFVWPPSRSMEAAADACELQLDELGVAYHPASEVGKVVRPMTIEGDIGGVTYTPVYGKNQVFDCQLVLTLASFAPRLYELGVREVKFGSAYRYTKVRVGGRTKNILSRHALGIALDVVSFVDAEGREANVEHDYKRGDQLLHDIERATNDSGMFRILLTPRNDPKSHHDHFHFEANPDYTEERTREQPSS